MFICFLLLAGWGNICFFFIFFCLVFYLGILQGKSVVWHLELTSATSQALSFQTCLFPSSLLSLVILNPYKKTAQYYPTTVDCSVAFWSLFFSLCFTLSNVYWPFSNFINFFFNSARSTINPLKLLFPSRFMLLISSIIIWL